MEWLQEQQLTRPVDLLYAFTSVEGARNVGGSEVADLLSKAKHISDKQREGILKAYKKGIQDL